MGVKRQDAWTPDDDLVLAEVTLRQIREGGTQLEAFEEVAEKLGRTPAACGFRWNSLVRKRYEEAIHIAKSQRQKNKQEKRWNTRNRIREELNLKEHQTTSLDAIIRFLRQHKAEVAEMQKKQADLEYEINRQEEKIRKLTEENEELKGYLNNVQTDYRAVNDDYKALIQIMDRARKLAILDDEENDNAQTEFRMESSENLERMDK
ncbi:RsfA family transcriptional regulator [Melghirimyces algeriensis]|uniref:Prespore-specific regulator n=1 Tax=Melghirimyces algeriensis TaxID=910412 RepID=A0A521BMP5_9BACL|nr:RsfA family transcriptional regulator [Melghirimyces algeriensis]SMO48369.1 prespore-specific regulator [Melghirimyces algeriensis]